MAVAGDFDPGEITRIAIDVFGDWKAKQPFERTPDPFRLLAGLPLEISDSHPDYPALVARELHARGRFPELPPRDAHPPEGGDLLRRRLLLLRQRAGRQGAVHHLRHLRARDVQRLEKAFREELERALADGFTTEEVQAPRTAACRAAA